MDDDSGTSDRGGVNLGHKFAALTVSSSTNNKLDSTSRSNATANSNSNNNTEENLNSNSDGLFQVMKAVEAAEATIQQQAEENTRLRTELQKKIQELEKNSSGNSTTQRLSNDQWDNLAGKLQGDCMSNTCVVNQAHDFFVTNSAPQNDPSAIIHRDPQRNFEESVMQSGAESQSGSHRINGTIKGLSDGQRPVENAGFPHILSASTTSLSPSRHQIEGELEQRFHLSGRGLVPLAEVSNSNLWKQTREHDEEILQLRRHLADYSIKEARLHNEKYLLEKRIAYMRMAFDQQQQDLVDAASKALSYRQDIIEENIRLTYALQAAQQERSTFVSFLMPLLAEYSLQPSVSDAQSIVSNLKVLFKHLQEKLIITEEKLKESHYQLAPWRPDMNTSNFPPQSPPYPIDIALTSHNIGLELVPQPEYSHGNAPDTSSSPQIAAEWNILGHRQGGEGDEARNNLEIDEMMSYTPLTSRNTAPHDVPTERPVVHNDSQPKRYSEETAPKQVTFSDTVSSAELHYLDLDGRQHEREPSANWSSKNSPYTATMSDPAAYSPYLPPVLEEPSSSFSEVGDDDPLPAIEGLQISGEAFPGRELQACGYSTNGTTSCNFEWVRHLEDGSVNYIDGAKQPNYLITADDVDTYLAIEVQPLDNRKRKGELVKVFANEHRKITCDPEMQNCIERTLYNGHASYRVSSSIGYLDIWEPATLVVKREGYSIKRSGDIITEKFSQTMSVSIPFGNASEFTICSSGGGDRILRAEADSTDISCSRDTIVLILRLFIIRAGEKRKVKKKGLFFK